MPRLPRLMLPALIILWTGVLVLSSIPSLAFPDRAASQQADQKPAPQKETTIRNLTKETIQYTIRRVTQDKEPFKMSIRENGLDRWPCSGSLDIDFERKGQTVSYRLECGRPYTFRYSENDEIELYTGAHGLFGLDDLAPYVPTPMPVVEKMLELARVDKDDVLYDLGCGDGRIVITAAQKYGARGVGIDIDPERIEESVGAAKEARVEGLVEFRLQDVMKADFSKATVVTLYLLPESNALLLPLLEEQLKPGTPVVTHNYSIPGWEKKEIGYEKIKDAAGLEHTIYVYQR